MKKVSVYKIALAVSLVCLLAVVLFGLTGHLSQAGPFCIGFFITLAMGVRGYAHLKGFTYTIMIFAAVTTAMYYPFYFLQWNGFKLATLITPLIQLIMFGMGTSMGLKDFAGVIKTPKGVFIGVVSHFIIMPLIGFTLARLSGLPPEIAAGIILIGCSPNGMASNVISYLAKANLALSITITAVSTMLAPFITPFLMKWLAGAFVKINALNMMWDIIKMVIIPIGAGILFNKLVSGRAKWLDKAMPLVSMFGIAFIIVIITAAGRDSLLTIGPLLVLFVLIHNLSGYTLGYWTGRLFKMDERDCRTMAIEVGMQNGGLASGLAKEMGKMATVGLAPAIFGPLMNVTGSILASWWHRRPPKGGGASPESEVQPVLPTNDAAVTGVTKDVATSGGKTGTTAAAGSVLFIIGGMLLLGSCSHQPNKATFVVMETGRDWPAYGGNKAGNRYSPLSQINIDNVKKLDVAWVYDARDQPDSGASPRRVREIQCQPIVVKGILYGTTPELNVFALQAGTGKRLWQFSPVKENQKFNTSRGLIYWENGEDQRILYTSGSTLYALNAQTGESVPGFGSGGKVDLHEGLGDHLDHDVSKLSVTASTPGVVYKNILIIGSSVSESGDAAPGHVRGFDVLTGKLLWTFHTIPQPGELGYDTWPKDAYKKIGAANNWGGMSVDEKRGLVYFGTGSPSSDFYGGDRAGINLFANCIVALHAETGKIEWYFQTIHHDLWDRDIPCPPNLVTIRHDGRMVDALVQTTKDGLVYVLDRDSGHSLFPIVERPVPVAGLPGEHPWPMQKFPLKPLPLSRQVLTEADLTDLSPEAHAYAKERFLRAQMTRDLSDTGDIAAGKFIPPSTNSTFLFGYSGGAEWGGNATDPDGIFYQNANEDAWDLQMVDMETRTKELANLSYGNGIYVKNCSFCHGMDRKGNGHEFPDLTGIGSRRSAAEISTLIRTGSGKMPSFQYLSDSDRMVLTAFLLNKEKKPVMAGPASSSEHATTANAVAPTKDSFPYTPKYVSKVWRPFRDQDGYNAVKPPWGTLNAIDLNTGDYRWRVPLGEFPELTKKGIPLTGTESYGGPLVTAGGLVFIAATRDERIRAFDKKTGRVVWEYQLPAGGFATPITYEVDGRQYLVIAAGGARGKKPGGWYIAFALK